MHIHIHVYIYLYYIYAGHLTGWIAFRLDDVNREKSKTRGKNNQDEEQEKTLKHKNSH